MVALGTDWLAVRIDDLPAGVEIHSAAAWSFASQGWHVVPIWESRLRELVAAALSHAVAGGMNRAAEDRVHPADLVHRAAFSSRCVPSGVASPANLIVPLIRDTRALTTVAVPGDLKCCAGQQGRQIPEAPARMRVSLHRVQHLGFSIRDHCSYDNGC